MVYISDNRYSGKGRSTTAKTSTQSGEKCLEDTRERILAEARDGEKSVAAALAFSVLRKSIALVAAAGQLRVAEQQAVSLYHAAAIGTVLSLLNSPAKARDLTISSMMREASLDAITTPAGRRSLNSSRLNAAVTLRAVLEVGELFSDAELALLKEWLSRIIKQESHMN